MTNTNALTLTRHLPVKLDQYRERILHTDQTEGRIEELRLTEHLKNVNDSVKQLIKDQQKKQTDAARALHAGYEMQDIACRQQADVEKHKMVTYRLDTGVPVDERALTVEEMREARKKAGP